MAARPVHFMALSLAGLALWTCQAALADTLLVEQVSAAQVSAADRPARGTSMASVEARFGSPTTRGAPVGQPPITRWDYPGFVVYFEYDHVVHAVSRPPPAGN